MLRKIFACVLVALCCCGLANGRGFRDRLRGLVYEVEDWSTPKDGWLLNSNGKNDRWCLWTTEDSVWAKRSNGQSLRSPVVTADRKRPEDGAPVLHTRITGIPKGIYVVYMNATNRRLGYSLDGGKSWTPTVATAETYLGYYEITDGVFEVWVDDCFVNHGSIGSGYYDYIRMETQTKAPSVSEIKHFTMPDGTAQISWISTVPMVPATVLYRKAGGDWQQVTEEFTGMRNHFVLLSDLEPGATYEAKIRAKLGPKMEKESASVTFVAGQRPGIAKSQTMEVPLSVMETTSQGRVDWPVTSGVPFARGVLASEKDVALFDGNGVFIPAWFEVMSRWDDGSVKWLSVNFKASTIAGKASSYVLKTGPEMGKNNAVLADVTERAGKMLEHLKSVLTLADGRVFTMDTTNMAKHVLAAHGRAVSAEYSGDYVNDKGERMFRWRLEMLGQFGAKNDLRLRFSVGNNYLAKPSVLVKSLSFSLNRGGERPADAPKVTWRTSDGVELPVGGSIMQFVEKKSLLNAGGKSTERGAFNGYLTAADGRLQIGFDDFWETYPKGVERTENGLCWWLLPELPKTDYPPKGWDDLLEECIRWYWFDNGAYTFRQGVEITHDINVRIDADEKPVTCHEWFTTPLFAQASTAYYCGTGAFGAIIPQAPGLFPEYEEAFDRSFKNLEAGRASRGDYGWMNFGDWYGERRFNWGDNEYDLSYTTAIHFARSGRLDWLWRGAEMARHYTTIDMVNYFDERSQLRELLYGHCMGHVGLFFQQSDPRIAAVKRFVGAPGALHDSGHAHIPGIFYYACLTGDWQLMRKAELCAWTQAQRYTRNFQFGIERAAGWPIINSTYAYAFTGNPYYLNASKLYFERVKEVQNPETGCFDLRQDLTECDCPDKEEHRGGKAFATGVLMHGLARLWEQTGDEDVKTCIIRCVNWLLNHSWNEKARGFRYKTGCPKYANSGWYAVIVTEGIAYATELTGDKRYIDFVERTIGREMRRSTGGGLSSGKDFAQFNRHIPHVMYYLYKHGITSTNLYAAPLKGNQSVVVDQNGVGTFEPYLTNPNANPMTFDIELSCADGSVSFDRNKASVTVAFGKSAKPEFKVQLKQGDRGTFTCAIKIGKALFNASVNVIRRPPAVKLGNKVGFIGGGNHFTLNALKKHGLGDVSLIRDIDATSLDGYKAVIVGGDAFAGKKNDVIPSSAQGFARLADFAAQGGLVICFQMNDIHWQTDSLGKALVIVEPESIAQDIVSNKHWLMEGVTSLQGQMCYDGLGYCDSAWNVLVKDNKGKACVLSLAHGKGEIVVILPNIDRVYKAGEKVANPEASKSMLDNVVRRCKK